MSGAQALAFPLSDIVVYVVVVTTQSTLLFSSQRMIVEGWVHIRVMQVLLDERGDADAAIESIIAAETREMEFSGGRNDNHTSSFAGFVESGKSMGGRFLAHKVIVRNTLWCYYSLYRS